MSPPSLSSCVVLAVTSETALLTIDGVPNLIRTHEFLRHFFSLQSLIIATTPTLEARARNLVGRAGAQDKILVCQTTDPHSLAKALEESLRNFKTVVIHDASRPLTTRNQFDKVITAMTNDLDAVRPATPFTETLKILDRDLMILGTLDRSSVLRISTPELIRISAIDVNAFDTGWFLPLRNDAHVLHIEGEPQGVRINSEGDRDLLELY